MLAATRRSPAAPVAQGDDARCVQASLGLRVEAMPDDEGLTLRDRRCRLHFGHGERVQSFPVGGHALLVEALKREKGVRSV